MSFGFQSLAIRPPGWVEELFHPDFNFKFPSWMARLIRRTSTSQQELTFEITLQTLKMQSMVSDLIFLEGFEILKVQENY